MTQKIIIALDTSDLNIAKKLVRVLWPKVQILKIGLEMINTGQAPELIKFINKLGGKVFYDIKLNDIPNTVGGAAKVISRLGVWGFTVHSSAGPEAIRAAVANKGKAKVIGITVLTSMAGPKRKILDSAKMLAQEGADGFVCAAKEVRMLKKFKKLIITPGIRPVWASKNEQERIATPAEALEAGADYLVIGRPVTRPPKEIGSSSKALELIMRELYE